VLIEGNLKVTDEVRRICSREVRGSLLAWKGFDWQFAGGVLDSFFRIISYLIYMMI
jgi:hypothetical protein